MSVAAGERVRASPYARRLARDRGVELTQLSGSGPGGRIVAADIVAFVPRVARPEPGRGSGAAASALAAKVDLARLTQVLGQFGDRETQFDLEDVLLRAAGCALDDVPEAASVEGSPVALEVRLDGRAGQLVFADIRKGSLAPLRSRRLAAMAQGSDQSDLPAAMTLRLVRASGIRPVMLPLLGGRAMRLVVLADETGGEALLVFDSAALDEDVAASLLDRFRGYLEVPLRLLA